MGKMNDGFLILDKPLQMSSRQLIDRVKPFYSTKIGHTGTLDPLATGMMVLSLGDATRFSQWIILSNKAYQATLRLGTQTSTDDLEGEVIKSASKTPSLEDIKAVLTTFIGNIEQAPPKFSAIHINGKRAYKLARQGLDFQIKKRPITVHNIEIIDYSLKKRELTLYIHCQSGTYIRSLARDIGEALQCYGHLSSLRRLWVSPFEKETMHTLEDLPKPLISLDDHFRSHPHIELSYEDALALAQGRPISLNETQALCAYYNHTFIGMIKPQGKLYRSEKLRSNVLDLIKD